MNPSFSPFHNLGCFVSSSAKDIIHLVLIFFSAPLLFYDHFSPYQIQPHCSSSTFSLLIPTVVQQDGTITVKSTCNNLHSWTDCIDSKPLKGCCKILSLISLKWMASKELQLFRNHSAVGMFWNLSIFHDKHFSSLLRIQEKIKKSLQPS